MINSRRAQRSVTRFQAGRSISKSGAATAVLALVTALALTDCGGSGGGSNSAPGTLTLGLSGPGTSLNPALDGPGTQKTMRSLAYAALIHLQPDGRPRPGLATAWRYVGSGNTTFELTLRHGARFSDGGQVNAGAVKSSLQYWAKNSPNKTSIDIKGIQTPDPYTVRINLASPNPSMPFLLSDQWTAGAVVSPAAQASSLGTQTAGAGPYALDAKRTVTGDHYVYVPNRYFYDKTQVKFSKVVVRVISNATSMLQAVNTGQFDVAVGDPTTAPAAERSGLKIVAAPTQYAALFITDLAGKIARPLGDARVRQALNYAIDRKAITTSLLGKYGIPTSEILTTDGFDPAYQNYYPYDPAKARSLLKAAGYPNGLTLGVVVGGYSGVVGQPMALAVAKYFAEVGVTLNIRNVATQAEYGKIVFSGTYPLVQALWTGNMSLTHTTILQASAIMNFSKVSNPQIEKLYASAVASSDPSTHFRKISAIATEQALSVPVFEVYDIWYVSKRIGGVALSGSSSVPLATEWYVK